MSWIGNYTEKREGLIRRLINSGVIHSPEVIRAMSKVPRHEFIPEEQRDYAYVDSPLSIGRGQTISAPHMVGMMAEALELRRGHKVLEVGTGSGYHAAVVAEVIHPNKGLGMGHVYSLEIIPELAQRATINLLKTNYDQKVSVVCKDGSEGYEEQAPYDRIQVTAAAPDIPPPLLEQLNVNGILVIPVGNRLYFQTLVKVRKISDTKIETETCGGVAFVPLIGRFGFQE
jgi:protein-L-isoaspartate(D-aspartate) O-methyltransferase